MGIKLPYKVLQLRKAYKTKLAYNDVCVKDETLLYKALYPKNFRNKAKIYGTLNAAKRSSLVFF